MTRKFTPQDVLEFEQYKLINDNFGLAMVSVIEAHEHAVNKFPHWPVSVHVGNTIIGEEYGEACKAALDVMFKDHPLQELLTEHAQAAAMHIRQLQHLLNVEDPQR
jgi:hypothetical protein